MSEDEKITIDDFMKVELKVAKVIEASEIEGADRLLKLQVDLGSEKRQLVAGIKKNYTPEELVGKHFVVVANLKPARLRGGSGVGVFWWLQSGWCHCIHRLGARLGASWVVRGPGGVGRRWIDPLGVAALS